MGHLRKSKYLVISLLLICGILFDMSLRKHIEESKRTQARYNLNQIHYCINAIEPYVGVDRTFSACTSEMRTTFTGDVYILDMSDLSFVQEVSKDVPQEELYFNKDSVGKYFKDWDSAKEALYYITSGKDSTSDLNLSYNFDGAKEWLEWKYIPNPHDTFNEHLYVAVQGIQSDEAYQEFSSVFWLMRSSVLIIIFILLIELSRCRSCDITRR